MAKKKTERNKEEQRREQFQAWAEGQSAVRTLLLIGGPEKRSGLIFRPLHWILAVTDVENYTEVFADLLGHLVQKDRAMPAVFRGDPVQALLQPAKKAEISYAHAYILYDDRSRLEMEIVGQKDLPAFLAGNSLPELCFDKDQILQEAMLDGNKQESKKQMAKPDRMDLQAWAASFFENIGNCALYLIGDEVLPAQISLSRARLYLIQMTRASIALSKNFLLDPGEDLENFKDNLDAAAYDHLIRSYSATDNRRIWDAVFQSCMLFRKAGLKMQGYEGFAYPKRLDVETMKFLRKEWEASR